MMTVARSRGVYILANDRVYDLTVAFLNSFRKFNPNTPLCLIPFDAKFSKINDVRDIYHFTIWTDQESLDYCDNISLSFHDRVRGHYRKLVIWNGNFDDFIYIDIDTIVLKNFDFAFDLLHHFDILTSVSNNEYIEKWTWKKSVHETGILSEEQIEYAANTGFIVSMKGVLQLKDAGLKLQDALSLKPHMELSCMEQPFLNYLIVTSGKKISSLYSILNTELYQEKFVECWGAENLKKVQGDWVKVEDDQQHKVLFIHWAGLWQNGKMDYFLFTVLQLIRIRKNIWEISLFMPKRKLWTQFRQMNRNKF